MSCCAFDLRRNYVPFGLSPDAGNGSYEQLPNPAMWCRQTEHNSGLKPRSSLDPDVCLALFLRVFALALR